MKFSEKVCFKIILKVTKNQGFTLSLEDLFFKKPQEGVKLTPPPFPPAVLGLNGHNIFFKRKCFIYFSGFSFYKTPLGFYIKYQVQLFTDLQLFFFIRCCATFNGGFFQIKVTQVYVMHLWHFISAITFTIEAFSF